MNQQLPRLLGIFLVGGVILIGARQYLIPPSFGTVGHYRADAVKAVVARERKYAGQAECAQCHPDVASKRAAGNHRGLSCETCHGPTAAHAQSPDTAPQIPQPRQFCPVCHAYDPSRPTGFPEIDPVGHNPLIRCTNCHDPHAPVPPVTPEECQACHGQIARAKAMSKHARLPCTTCHQAPEKHKHTPHVVRPTKPANRSFCVQCHAQADTVKQHGAPQIDVTSHHERYLCWDCHYPHNPKAQ
jgi:hypothetical protein